MELFEECKKGSRRASVENVSMAYGELKGYTDFVIL